MSADQPDMKHATTLLIIGLVAGSAQELLAKSPRGSGREAMLVEVQPLSGVVGHLSARAEFMPLAKFAFGLAYERSSAAGERSAFDDRFERIAIESLCYPLGQNDWPVFIGAGLTREATDIGRSAPRSTLTWARTRADELEDEWVNHDVNISAHQVVGWRIFADSLLTASLRYTRDEILTSDSRVEADNVVTTQDLSTRGRAPVEQRVTLHAGLYLP